VDAVIQPTPDLSIDLPTPTAMPGGLPTPGGQSPQQVCQALATNFPEDRSRLQGTDVTLSLIAGLGDRFQAANLAMQVLRDAQSADVVRCGSQVALDVLVGRGGRHTSPTAYSPGTLPADQPRDQLRDPGMAISIYGISQSEAIRNLVSDTMLGGADSWSEPPARWDAIDSAVSRGVDGVASLNGRLPRLVGWALLASQSSVSVANQIGARGVEDAQAGVEAAKSAFDLQCSQVQDARCP
jgi:hypothetical protein